MDEKLDSEEKYEKKLEAKGYDDKVDYYCKKCLKSVSKDGIEV